MDLELKYLEADKTRSLINVINFILNPKSLNEVINLKGVATKLSIQEHRYTAICSGVQKIKGVQIERLINDIKDNEKIVIEFCNALKTVNENSKNGESVKFLISLFFEANADLKINIFEAIFVQDKEAAFNILDNEKENNIKNDYIEQAKKSDLEATVAYLMYKGYKNLNVKELDIKNLFKYLYQIQLNSNIGLLDVIEESSEQWDILISWIKEKIKIENFKALYFLSMNEKHFKDELDSDNILKGKVDSIRYFVKIMKNKYGGHQLDYEVKVYMQKWDINLIFFHLANIESIDKDYGYILVEKIFSNMSKFIINIENKDDEKIIVNFILSKVTIYPISIAKKLLQVLVKIKLTNKNLKILSTIYNEYKSDNKGLNQIITLVRMNLKNLDDYTLIERFIGDPLNLIKDIVSIPIIFILIELENRDISTILDFYKKLKEINIEFAKEVLNETESYCIDCNSNFIVNNLIKIFLLDEFNSNNEEITIICDDYMKLNKEDYLEFIESFDGDNLLEQLKTSADKFINLEEKNNITILLRDQEEKKYYIELVTYILDKLCINNKLMIIINIWGNVKLNITKQIEYRERIKIIILNNKESLNNEVIGFMIREGIDDIVDKKVLSIINNNSKMLNEFLLQWYDQGKLGKITEIIKYIIENEIKGINDIYFIEEQLKKFEINDIKLNVLIQLKVYSLIENMLLELNNDDIKFDTKVTDLLNQIIKHSLEERLLSDKFLLNQLEPYIVKKLRKSLLEISKSEKILALYWNVVEDLIDEKNIKEIMKQLEILLPYITINSKRIDWFLEKIENRRYDSNIKTLILEVALEFMNKYRISINQYETEKRLYEKNNLEQFADNIKDSLTDLETCVIRISDNIQGKSILINNIKALRKDLCSIGIGTVESVNLYGEEVEIDVTKHKCLKINLESVGKVESLGLKVMDSIIRLNEVRCIKKGGILNE